MLVLFQSTQNINLNWEAARYHELLILSPRLHYYRFSATSVDKDISLCVAALFYSFFSNYWGWERHLSYSCILCIFHQLLLDAAGDVARFFRYTLLQSRADLEPEILLMKDLFIEQIYRAAQLRLE